MKKEEVVEKREVSGKSWCVGFFIFLFLFSSFSSFVSASCSIGATPLAMGAKVEPGTTVEVTWNFYNLYGDRTTHITVSKLIGPDWGITYNPELHEQAYDISGVIVNQTENVAIPNSSVVVLTIPESIPEGWSYVKHPTKEGYIPVKQIKIYIEVPEKAKLWETSQFIFQAKGDCFMEPGTVIPAIAIQMKVNITTANLEFSEKPVGEKGTAGTGTGFSIFGLGTATSVLMITTLIFVVVIVLLLIKGARKSSKEKAQNAQGVQSSQEKSTDTDPLVS